MSWQKTSVMEEKLKFILAWKSGLYTVSDLCRMHGVSRVTGYRLINRYKEEGEDCLLEQSKRPKNSSPHKTPLEIEQAIIKLRSKYKNWGARKLIVLLEREYAKELIPSETTVNKILSRNGLVKKRRRRSQKVERANPKFDPQVCNEIWSADYKGQFRLGNRRYCYPLTITDKYSRYLFTSKGHYSPNYESVKREYRQVFRKYGQPKYIHTDNGSPFGSIRSVKRYSKLCYWLIDQGIEPLFSDPGCPQQNGRHERMHRDLKAYCCREVENTLSAQQEKMDGFRAEFNLIRPHEALNMATPDSVHERSTRAYSERKRPFTYDSNLKVLKVMKNGAIRWGAYNWVFVSEAAIRRYMGMEEIGNGIWMMYYRHVLLGYFDEKLINRKEQYLKLANKVV